MSQELDKSICQLRAAVLVRLAVRRKLYVNVPSVYALVKTLDDDGVWSLIVRSNSGLAGFFRRMLNRFVDRTARVED